MKSQNILDSWKAIADYLDRDKTTCYRWEKNLGLPVHRIDETSSRSKVFAFQSEIDQWLKNRAGENELPGSQRLRHRIPDFLLVFSLILIAGCLVLVFRTVLSSSDSQKLLSNTKSYPNAFQEIDSLNPLMEPGVYNPAAVLKRFEHINDPWELYHRGDHYLNKQTQNSNELAMALFLRAIRIDENFWPALIGLAQGYVRMVRYGWDPSETRLDQAIRLLERTATTDSNAPDYCCTMGETLLLRYTLFNGNTRDQAHHILQEGLRRMPNHPQLNTRMGEFFYLSYGEYGREADFQKALKYMEKSFWLKPHSLDNIMYAELLLLDQDYSRALEVCGQLKNIDPSRRALFLLGVILYYSGELEKSLNIFTQFEIPLKLKTESLFYQGMIAVQMGEIDEAKQILMRLDTFVPLESQSKEQALKRASLHFGLGNDEQGYSLIKLRFSSSRRDPTRFVHARYVRMDKNLNQALEDGRLNGIFPLR